MNGQVGGPRESGRARTIPEATVARLAVYLRILSGLGDRQGERQSMISSEELAESAGVNVAVSICDAPAFSKVPAAGEYVTVPGRFAVALSWVDPSGVP